MEYHIPLNSDFEINSEIIPKKSKIEYLLYVYVGNDIINLKLKKGLFMKKKLLLLPFLMTALLYTGCVPKTSPRVIQTNSTPTDSSNNIPPQVRNLPFSYNRFQTVQGPILTVGKNRTGFMFPDFKGKIILLELFGQDCPHCFKELPSINNLFSKYRQKLQVVALQVSEPMSKEKANSLIRKFNINYPIIDRENATNLMIRIRDSYEWHGVLPLILLIKDGVTQGIFKGETSQQEIERAIQELL